MELKLDHKKKINIVVIDTETSNLQSVIYACKKNFINTILIKDYSNISFNEINGLIFPGVGSFSYVMKKLRERKLDRFIIDFLNTGKPSLFICLGMQLLFSYSEEMGKTKGLGVFPGLVKRIPAGIDRHVPFTGWNLIKQEKKNRIFNGIKKNEYFYFTHAYYVLPEKKNIIHAVSEYSKFSYCTSISSNNIYATQFHPEKSSINGLKIYKNFKNLCSKFETF
jgi:glutamine amidotransferase